MTAHEEPEEPCITCTPDYSSILGPIVLFLLFVCVCVCGGRVAFCFVCVCVWFCLCLSACLFQLFPNKGIAVALQDRRLTSLSQPEFFSLLSSVYSEKRSAPDTRAESPTGPAFRFVSPALDLQSWLGKEGSG